MRKLTFILFSSIFSLSVFAQEANWTQAEKCSADSLEQYIKGRTLYPNWIKGSHYFSYDVKSQDGNRHYLVNAENGKRKSMIKDNEQFVRQYAQITGDTLDAKDIQLYGYQFKNNDFSRFYLDKKGKSMVYDMNTGKLSEVPVEKKMADRLDLKQSCHSADSLYSMLGSEYDLFVRDNRTGSVKRITFDGKEDASYTYRHSKDTVSTNSKGFWLGHRYIYMMQDMSEVKEISLIHSLGN